MYHHTQTNHSGAIGPNRGQTDYKIQLTDRFTNNLRRQAQEGERQLLMEEYQDNGKVNLLNSKLDFNKPFKSSLTVINKMSNIKPGIPGPIYPEQTRAFGTNTKKKTVGECTNSTELLDPMTSTKPFLPTSTSTPTKTMYDTRNKQTEQTIQGESNLL